MEPAKSESGFQRGGDFTRDLNQRGNERCQRVARRHHQSDTVRHKGIDDRNDPNRIRQTEGFRESCRITLVQRPVFTCV